MAVLKVAQLGHPILRRVADAVDPASIGEPAFQRFLDDLLETMEDYDGAGLAAPQVHVSERVVVLRFEASRDPDVLINPEIRPLSGLRTRTLEGCLSVEGLRGVVERPAHVRLDALDRQGRPIAYELKGFPAVVVQHECDHLDGVLYVDRVERLTLGFTEEVERWGPLDRMVPGYEEPERIAPLVVVLTEGAS